MKVIKKVVHDSMALNKNNKYGFRVGQRVRRKDSFDSQKFSTITHNIDVGRIE